MMHLLHVEDDALSRELVRAALDGHPRPPVLVPARTVAQALALLRNWVGPVAVLCDSRLTDGNVEDVLAAITGRPEVRVVVLCGVATPEIRALADHPNVAAVFEKPMRIDDLQDIIDEAVLLTA